MWEEAPSLAGWAFDPAALVRMVNGLQGLGEAESTRIVRAYAASLDRRERGGEGGYAGLGRLYLVARLLWQPASERQAWPALRMGRPDIELPPPDSLWPLLPLAMSWELPFLLAGSYKIGGALVAATETIARMLEQAGWRGRALCPEGDALGAMQALIDSPLWRVRISEAHRGRVEAMLLAQALRAMTGAIEVDPSDLRRLESASPSITADLLARYRRAASARHVVWSREIQRFVGRAEEDPSRL